MALRYNNTTITDVNYNNSPASRLIYNGTEVFTYKPPYEDFLNVSTISESDFLTKVCVPDTFDDINSSTSLPYAKNFVGKNITLTHPAQTIPWTIIGYNHDGTSYTFDLWSSASIYDNQPFSSSSQTYSSSTVRTSINNMVSGFSSDIQERLLTMSVQSQQAPGLTSTNDKAKLLSLTEMGITSGNYHPGVEGNTYSNYFTSGRSTNTRYTDLIRKKSNGANTLYWTRSRFVTSVDSVFDVEEDGSTAGRQCDTQISLLPVIRISIPA